MSVNPTSFSNSSPESPSTDCTNSSTPYDVSTAFNATRVCLLLPLSILILHLGHRRWRQQRSFKTMSHSDVFTYHTAALELICNIGLIYYTCGFYYELVYVEIVGSCSYNLIFCGEMSFHLLTCGERYLAVVHPVTYLQLRNARGVRIRNASVGAAWVLCFAWSATASMDYTYFPTVQILCSLAFSLVVVSFCSISALCALRRPGPGDGGGNRKRVDQPKQRAFLTITAITGVLSLWFGGFVVCFAVGLRLQLCDTKLLISCGMWFMLPACSVLPLLYLHRTGTISCK